MSHSGEHVLVLGMARSGRAAVELLLRDGARVCAYDRTPQALEGLPASVETFCAETLPDFARFDTVVQSPGVRVDASARAQEQLDRGASGARESEHENALPRVAHRSFNSEIATRPRITEMIQNRTMICGSGQPRSS